MIRSFFGLVLVSSLELRQPTMGQELREIRQDLLQKNTEEIEKFLKSADTIETIFSAEDITDEKLKAYAALEPQDSESVMKVAIAVRRKLSEDDQYLLSEEAQRKLFVLKNKLNRERTRLLFILDDMSSSLSRTEENFGFTIKTLTSWANFRWRLERNWRRALAVMWVGRLPDSLSEAELDLAIKAYGPTLKSILKSMESEFTYVANIRELLNDHHDKNIRTALRQWMLGESIRLNPLLSLDPRSPEEILNASQSEYEELVKMVTQKAEEMRTQIENFRAEVQSLARGLAEKSKSQPDEIYKMLEKGLQ